MPHKSANLTSRDAVAQERHAWGLFNAAKYAEAHEAFSEALLMSPDSVGALQGQIATYRKELNFPEAEQLLSEALSRHRRATGLLGERAWLSLEQGKIADAINAFTEMLKVAEDDEGIFIWTISLLRSQREFDQAERYLRRAFQLFPNSMRLRVELAWIRFYERRYDDALRLFEDLRETQADYEPMLQGLAATLRMMGRYAEARTLLKRAFRQKWSAGLWSESGWLWFAVGDYATATRDFRMACQLAPNDAYGHVNLAWSLIRQGTKRSLERAACHCDNAIRLSPNLSDAFGCRGIISFKQGYLVQAETYLLRSIEANPVKGCYADLGALYLQTGRYREAKLRLKEAIRYEPRDAYAHLQLGQLALIRSRPAAALAQFRQSVALEPQNPEGHRLLALGLIDDDKKLEAEIGLRRALKQLDRRCHPPLHLALCELYCKLGDDSAEESFYHDALREANCAIRISDRNAAAHFCRGVVRAKLQDFDGALKSFSKSRRLDTSNVLAEANEARIKVLLKSNPRWSRTSKQTTVFLIIVFLAQLSAVWLLKLNGDKISNPTFLTLVGLFSGLTMLTTLIPWLSKFKVTGLEAELVEPTTKHSLASGPKGDIGFGSAFPPTMAG